MQPTEESSRLTDWVVGNESFYRGIGYELKEVCPDKGIMSELRDEAPILRDQVEGRRELVPSDPHVQAERKLVTG